MKSIFRLSCLIILSISCRTTGTHETDKKIYDVPPNIIWIMSEDMGQDLGCYGMKGVRTPILDKMATEGILYQNCIATNPICSPSRSAMMTGMHQTRIGAHNHRSHRDIPLPAGIFPMTHYLRQQGYTCILGHDGIKGGGRKLDLNFKHAAIGPYDGQENFGLFDKKGTFEQSDQPFFAQITLNVTHRGDWWKEIRKQAGDPVSSEAVDIPPYMADHPVVREQWATYLDQIEYMDQEVGMILEDLEQKGMLDNTVIFFVGDNGRCDIRGKGYLYDPGVKVPMIAWGKGIQPEVVDDIVSTIDITASILDLAGSSLADSMKARPLFGEQKGPERVYFYSARDGWDEVNECMRSITTKRYKYIKNYLPDLPWDRDHAYLDFHRPAVHIMRSMKAEKQLSRNSRLFFADSKPEEELYDLQEDPHELVNLAQDDTFQDVLTQMRAHMSDWQQNNQDTGLEDLGQRQLNSSKAPTVRNWLQSNHPEEWQKILDGELVDQYKTWVKSAFAK